MAIRVEECFVHEVDDSRGPGNALAIHFEFDHGTRVFTAFGKKGVSAEAVGRTATSAARAFLVAGAPVDEHLADQLLVPMALLAGGTFRTGPLTDHFTTNADVIDRFLPGTVSWERDSEQTFVVRVRGRCAS